MALHSAHWARPFVEAMYEHTRIGALAKLSPAEREKAVLEEVYPPGYRAPKREDPITPSADYDRSKPGPDLQAAGPATDRREHGPLVRHQARRVASRKGPLAA